VLKTSLKYAPVFLLLFLTAIGFGFHLNGTEKPVPVKDPNSSPVSVSKKALVHLVDSLLDLERVDPQEIELVSYYNSLLAEEADSIRNYKSEALAGLNFYENLEDEDIIFPPLPEKEYPDSVVISMESDKLSFYTPPISGVVTSHFGFRDKRMHKGIDVDLNKGDVVKAAFDGKVRVAKRKGGYGNVIVIMHPNGLETVYAHLHKFKVKTGDVVLSGQPIALGGNTGHSTGSHLHFEVRYKGVPLNPAAIISFTDNKSLSNSIVVKKSRNELCAYPLNARVYTIQRGESWYVITKKFGLSSKQLCELNGTAKRMTFRVGQKIRVN